MNFFLLDDPANPAEFAQFAAVGTWADDRSCDVCGEASSRLVEPLQIEWDEGTDRIGDFSWAGYHCVILMRFTHFSNSTYLSAVLAASMLCRLVNLR
jgi:hypothetical protein